MPDLLLLRLLRFLPKNLLSRGFGWLASRTRPRWFAQGFMHWFARRFDLDLEEAELPIEHYPCLLGLFTRKLKEGARPIDTAKGAVISPVDAVLGTHGKLDGSRLLQAKGLDYSVTALLGSETAAAPFRNGAYATLYLSPKDYHRIHAPHSGVLTHTLYEPGTLWPVNPPAVANLPNLFAVNERVTSVFSTDIGPVAIVMVGATNVGRIRLAYEPFSSNRGQNRFEKIHTPPLPLDRGDHLATFELGSTVILLIGSEAFEWDQTPEGTWHALGTQLGKTVRQA